jgi:hypothetical protein
MDINYSPKMEEIVHRELTDHLREYGFAIVTRGQTPFSDDTLEELVELLKPTINRCKKSRESSEFLITETQRGNQELAWRILGILDDSYFLDYYRNILLSQKLTLFHLHLATHRKYSSFLKHTDYSKNTPQNRFVTVVHNLSKRYAGGNFRIKDLKGRWRDYHLPYGSMVVFYPELCHRVMQTTYGTRISLVYRLSSKKPFIPIAGN